TAATRRGPAVAQFVNAIHAIGVLQLRQLETEIRPLRSRRQVIAREGVVMRRHCRRSSGNKLYSFPRKRESTFSCPGRAKRDPGPRAAAGGPSVPGFAETNRRQFCSTSKQIENIATPPPMPTFRYDSSTARERPR